VAQTTTKHGSAAAAASPPAEPAASSARSPTMPGLDDQTTAQDQAKALELLPTDR